MKYLKIAAVILYLLPSCYALGQDISGSSQISYNTSSTETDGEKSSSRDFLQSHYLNYNTYLTPALSSNLGIRYNRRDSNMQDQETIYPFINLGLMNEYLSGNLGYNYMEVKSSDNPSLITSFWNTNLTSQLEEEWPKLNFQYTETRQYDDLAEHKTDTKSTSLLSGVTYQYSIFDMMYNYMRSTSLDYPTLNNPTETDSKSNNHISRLGMYKSFWDNRITISADGGYNYYDTTTTVPEAGEIEQRRLATGGFYGVDSSPEHSTLSSASGLIDRNYDTAVITVQEYMNIGLDLIYPQAVDTIYIYTDKDYSYDPAISSEVLEWAVYYTDEEIETKTWTRITSSALFSYNETYHRFEISFTPQEARHFKVVYYPGTTSPTFQITEIEAYGLQYVDQISKTDTKTYTGNCALSIRPLKDWTTSYYLSYYRTDTSPQEIMNYTLGQGVNLTGDLSRYFLVTLSYQKTLSHMTETDTEVDTYAFNWHSNPLETLNTTLTLSYGETMEDEELISKINTLTFNSIFMLWKGIDVNWDLNLANADNVRDDTKSISAYSDLYVRALLTRRLSWDLGYNQGYQQTDNEETTKTTSSNIYSTLVYTPSSRLYGRIYLRYETAEEESRFSHEYSVGCFITPKIQINATSCFEQAEDRDEMTHSLDLNWNISRWASLRTGYSYSDSRNETTQENHNFYSRFSVTF
jgi:hypothetical protein